MSELMPTASLLLTVVAALVWVAAGVALLRRASKSVELRDGVFIVLTIAVGAAWAGSFGFFSRPAAAKTAKASSGRLTSKVNDRTPHNCAAVRLGTSAEEVRTILGEPSLTAQEEDIWGPGAVLWRFDASHCRVHLIDDVVHLVD